MPKYRCKYCGATTIWPQSKGRPPSNPHSCAKKGSDGKYIAHVWEKVSD